MEPTTSASMEPTTSALLAAGFLPALPRNLNILFPSPATYNHSMRTFLLASLITTNYLPTPIPQEPLYLLSLLHDLGTTLPSSLSFEYSGGIAARSLLLSHSASPLLADSIAEAIFRHQDIYFPTTTSSDDSGGNLTALTAAVQLSTMLDNTGRFAHLVDARTLEEVVAAWPRLGWSGCFSEVLRREGEVKPWCHTGVIGVEKCMEEVRGNVVMNRFE